MRGAIPPLPQYAFMAWCSFEAQGQLYLLQYTTLNQRYAYEQCYHPTEREIKKRTRYFLTYFRTSITCGVD
jgi:hypothetical protein